MLAKLDSRKGIYIGTGAGLILFVLLGFFPSAMMGGYVGLKLAELIMGPGSMGVVARLFTALSMIGAVLVTAVVFVLGGAIAGYILSGKLRAKEAGSKA
ncbi:hypothetical protein THC_1320 [Caldimicrobium thiodismutans]|jgi:hypothetical protein|uniref:Uncharacterized protein n=1 Tax=Caldimicrobium thiodismutans TaxID=1653476 RepID=A0A0U5AWH5_9BACT|nr:hypothetical protein [Caldimicrobium thiodismutans]BAU23688.1 hypothetical protein THC_1320 [Caldimicrobium thiodismutans]